MKLTKTQTEVMELAAQGLTNLAIGNALNRSPRNIRTIWEKIYQATSFDPDNPDLDKRVSAILEWLNEHH